MVSFTPSCPPWMTGDLRSCLWGTKECQGRAELDIVEFGPLWGRTGFASGKAVKGRDLVPMWNTLHPHQEHDRFFPLHWDRKGNNKGSS